MPPLQPVLKRKVDELFLRWLSDPNTQRALHDGLRCIRNAPRSYDVTRGGPGTPPDVTSYRPEPPDVTCVLPLACSRPVRASSRSPGHRKVQPPQEDPPPPASSRCIPAFYFPHGRPPETLDVDAALNRIKRVFAEFPQERATVEDMGRVAKDVVNTHPGLSFLKEAPEFHSRYITTVIQRIFYTVNRSWSGRITSTELRRSSFLQNVKLLEVEPDINQLTEFFSYEHFYVIYCKFWELDTDHDLQVDAWDLGHHSDHAISSRMIDRIFSGAVTRPLWCLPLPHRDRKVQKDGKISYADFVWFLLSEEDKKTPTSIEYWFRCMDLDGDGVLSLYELEYFYKEQMQRLDARAIEPLPLEDCVCQMLDLVQPRIPGKITLPDLKRCKLAHVFFNTFFNVDKYLDYEQREQASLLRESDPDGPELSDWEKYAAEEYDFLVAEEVSGDPWDDDLPSELSPMEQKLNTLWSPLAQRSIAQTLASPGNVDLYACVDSGQEPRVTGETT
ncbi:serine/threonine-protein phosphatase 2A regulatory subunit B'' subunit beta isoform X3 [Microtus ochrogaster]|uniref:Serine/threonine-protein phosphatase 2A regulatory subunit B'' subunit beta isoform X3 n=1 Tax=Microtus ochrogaster TaxID=79684 RepID=A0ABM1U106_MICOH|nr:serine/threonine-protein phosphatase 2A regulatory subunit B'' subunit beta isoform X3 [Microtus ochrogaster]